MKHKHNENIFVLVVGISAWLHTSWSFANIIGGESPATTFEWFFGSLVNALQFLYWFAPAALTAAAVDIGMIKLASQFRSGQGSKARLTTFAVLSLISYIGQLLFSLSHARAFHPSSGLSPISAGIAGVVWELLIWTFPIALPAVLVLFAWGDVEGAKIEALKEEVILAEPEPEPKPEPKPEIVPVPVPRIEPAPQRKALPDPRPKGPVITKCPDCGWSESHPDSSAAYRALVVHKRTCSGVRISMPEKKEDVDA